jgi:hypothetical protein
MSSSSIDWSDVTKKEARGSNDEDLGEVQEVGQNYVLVQKGMINKENSTFHETRSRVMMAMLKEEVYVKKKPVTETKTVTDQVTSEKARVKGSGGEGEEII